MKKELPIMIFHKDNQDYYGGDQDWFPDEWARRAGCASVCAADMACFYEHNLDISYPDFLELLRRHAHGAYRNAYEDSEPPC